MLDTEIYLQFIAALERANAAAIGEQAQEQKGEKSA